MAGLHVFRQVNFDFEGRVALKLTVTHAGSLVAPDLKEKKRLCKHLVFLEIESDSLIFLAAQYSRRMLLQSLSNTPRSKKANV